MRKIVSRTKAEIHKTTPKEPTIGGQHFFLIATIPIISPKMGIIPIARNQIGFLTS